MTPVLAAREASFVRQDRVIVDRVSLDLAPGRITVVVGPNGAGKTTLFRLMSGDLRPSAGAVWSDGDRLTAVAPWRLACRRAVMTQAARVAFAFTVFEVVRLGLDGIGRVPPRARASIVERCLARVDLLPFANRTFDTLSGGEQRRAQFARALAQLEAGATVAAAQALLLDEPVANLDLKHQVQLMEAAREAASRGVAVLAILHDLNLAARYADFILLMDKGVAVAAGPPATALTSARLSAVFGLELAVVGGAKASLILPSELYGKVGSAAKALVISVESSIQRVVD